MILLGLAKEIQEFENAVDENGHQTNIRELLEELIGYYNCPETMQQRLRLWYDEMNHFYAEQQMISEAMQIKEVAKQLFDLLSTSYILHGFKNKYVVTIYRGKILLVRRDIYFGSLSKQSLALL